MFIGAIVVGLLCGVILGVGAGDWRLLGVVMVAAFIAFVIMFWLDTPSDAMDH